MRSWWGFLASLPWVMLPLQLPLFLTLRQVADGGRIPIPSAEIALSVAGLLLAFGAIVAYVVRIARDRALAGQKKAPWIAAAILLNGVALPAYWWRHIR